LIIVDENVDYPATAENKTEKENSAATHTMKLDEARLSPFLHHYKNINILSPHFQKTCGGIMMPD
jgi:hypothetical protein